MESSSSSPLQEPEPKKPKKEESEDNSEGNIFKICVFLMTIFHKTMLIIY